MQHLMIVLIQLYQINKPFFEKTMSIFEEYGAFNRKRKDKTYGTFDRLVSKVTQFLEILKKYY